MDDKEKQLIYRYKPYLRNKKDYDSDDEYWIYFNSGLLGSIFRGKLLFIFILFYIFWLIIFWATGEVFDLTFHWVPFVKADQATTYSSIYYLYGWLLSLLFGAYFTKVINNRDYHTKLFTKIISKTFKNCSKVIEHVNWNKMNINNLSYGDKSYNDSDNYTNNFFINIKNLIFIYACEAYKLHHYMNRNTMYSLDMARLPIPSDLRKVILGYIGNDSKGNKLKIIDETKLDIIKKYEHDSYNYLVNEGYLSKDISESIKEANYDTNIILAELYKSYNINTPLAVKQTFTYGFPFLYVISIPISWRGYGFIWGSIFSWVLILIYIGLTNSLDEMKKIFDNPEHNPAIYGKTIGMDCKLYSERVFNFCELYLAQKDLYINFKDKSARIYKL